MLEKSRQIVTRVAEAPDLAAAPVRAVRGVRAAVSADACAAYLVDPSDDRLTLMEVDGFERDAIGRVRLAPGEGVVGLVRERCESIALDDAREHPRFRHFPEIGEMRFRGFLGVPIIHRRKVIGVLVVVQRSRRKFGAQQEAFLVTVSAQLASALAEALVQSRGKLPLWSISTAGFVQGIVSAPGVALGEVVAPSPFAELDAVEDRPASETMIEEAAFREAMVAVQADLLASKARMQGFLPSETHALFEVYAMLGGDQSLATRVVARHNTRDGSRFRGPRG